MKKTTLTLVSLFILNLAFSQEYTSHSENELIIKLKQNSNINLETITSKQKFSNLVLDSLNKLYIVKKIKPTGNKRMKNTFILKFNNKQNISLLIKSYLKTGLFEYVEPNYIGKGHGVQVTPNDTYFSSRQWSHYNDGTFSLSTATADADIDTDLAWDITQGDPNLIVAILDSGLKLNHPEFSGRIWNNNNETLNGLDSDSNGYIDDINGGWDFANNDNYPADDHGHGTNVAGIALATGNNGIGYAGVNWNSKVMICKILDNTNSGYYTWWADAIYYAVDNGANVINMSAGGNGASTLLEDAINYAYSNNVPVVVSTGNQNSVIQYPAKYSNAFAIGSTNSDDTRSVPFFWDVNSGSNFGPELDFVAPGNYIYGLSYNSNTNYNTYWGGTSQAAPHVAGVISLLLSIDPNLSVDQIRTILQESSEDQVGDSDDTIGWDQYYGFGRINAYNAVTNQVLGLNEFNNFKNNILVYPNPFSYGKNLTIANIDNDDYQIIIYNMLGEKELVFNSSINSSKIKLQIPKLASGTYFIKIINKSNNMSITKKFIIK
jgi:subtilisin family serine protease